MGLQARYAGGSVVALLCLALAIAGCGSSQSSISSKSSSAASTNSGKTLIVFGAGTLATPWALEIAAFKAEHPGITVHSEFGASGDRVKAITQLGEPADVLGVADYSLIPAEMFGTGSKQFATWYVGFVSNQITFAYTSHSKGAGSLRRRTGTECWRSQAYISGARTPQRTHPGIRSCKCSSSRRGTTTTRRSPARC